MSKCGNGFTDLSETASITASRKLSMANFPPLDAPKKRGALAIFCRAPRLGTVKTRIAQTHGDAFALGLYRAMLLDTFDLARRLAPEIETFACFTPRDGFEGEDSLAGLWDGPKIAQSEGDLGAKILDCFAQLRERGLERIAVIGSDSPDLPIFRIQEAFATLEHNELTVGRSSDGGFYLMGASRELPDTIFEGIQWSDAFVFWFLSHNIRNSDLRACYLPAWHDVDDESDLYALRHQLSIGNATAQNTQEFLENSVFS